MLNATTKKKLLTSWTSSTARYASVGRPKLFGFASIITRTDDEQ